jgi:SulP family sulfate permease
MLIVMGTVVVFDLMTAVAVGIAISTVVFLIQMSKSIVRNGHSGAKIRSKRQRSLHAIDLLRVHGDQIAILELEGTLFFGSTDALLRAIDDRVESRARYIILDLKRVKGADISGARVLVQTYTQMREKGVTLLFSYLYSGTELRAFLNDLGLLQSVAPGHMFMDTDQALECCEELLLLQVSTDGGQDAAIVMHEVLGLKNVDVDALQLLSAWTTEERFKAGELLCRQGDPGDAMYIISKGLIDVTISVPGQNRKRRLATFGRGSVFGEMALLDQGKRTADIEVKEDLTCHKVTTEAMEYFQRAHPQEAMMILKTLSLILVARVRQLTETIAELES